MLLTVFSLKQFFKRFFSHCHGMITYGCGSKPAPFASKASTYGDKLIKGKEAAWSLGTRV